MFGFVPFSLAEADCAVGLGGGLRETRGFALGFLRNGRRGFGFCFFGAPFGYPGALAGGWPEGGGALMLMKRSRNRERNPGNALTTTGHSL